MKRIVAAAVVVAVVVTGATLIKTDQFRPSSAQLSKVHLDSAKFIKDNEVFRGAPNCMWRIALPTPVPGSLEDMRYKSQMNKTLIQMEDNTVASERHDMEHYLQRQDKMIAPKTKVNPCPPNCGSSTRIVQK